MFTGKESFLREHSSVSIFSSPLFGEIKCTNLNKENLHVIRVISGLCHIQ